MDQMADETTRRADVKDKGGVNSTEESSAWARGERIQSEPPGLKASAERRETCEDTDAKQPRERDRTHSPRFSLKNYLKRAPSAESSTTDSLSSSQKSNTGVDCAGIVLSCLFCRFYDERLANHCCPSYQHVSTPVDSASSSGDDSYIDLDCGLFSSCQDASDCLELAMEVSELCYH